MKNLNLYINESLVTSKPIGELTTDNLCPKTRNELIECIISEINRQLGADNKIIDLNNIDTSNITDMTSVFEDSTYRDHDCSFTLYSLQIRMSKWDVSNVTKFDHMFKNWRNFDYKEIQNWDVHNMNSAIGMFYGCINFDADLSNWDVSNLSNARHMFYNCYKFKGNGLQNWDVSNVKNFNFMFKECEEFDCDLSNWHLNSFCQDLIGVFYNCKKFKGTGLANLNTNMVRNISGMFYGCRKFNEDISSWDVRHIRYMNRVFAGCTRFNQPLNKWNLSVVSEMEEAFYYCESFTYNLDNWNIDNKYVNTKKAFIKCPKKPKWIKRS